MVRGKREMDVLVRRRKTLLGAANTTQGSGPGQACGGRQDRQHSKVAPQRQESFVNGA